MNQPTTQQLIDRNVSEPTQLTPLNLIRTETVLSRLPIHNLAKKGRVNIQITKKNEHGEVDLRWEVSYNERYGQARQLAYKLDTIIINQKIDQLGRPLPKIIRLGSLREIGKELDLSVGQPTVDLKKGFLQDASTFITAKLRYKANDGTERTLEAGFTRYSVIFTGERLPDGTKADAVYIILNDPYWEVLNNAPVRPLNYDYLKVLTPSAQRFYEIVSYKIFTALKYHHPHAKLSYSDYCTFSAQQRYTDYDHFKKQMYKVHRPHKASGYLDKVSYEATTDSNGNPDWMMYYVPGPKAKAEYQTCNGNKQLTKATPQSEAPLSQRSRGQAQKQEPPRSSEDSLVTPANNTNDFQTSSNITTEPARTSAVEESSQTQESGGEGTAQHHEPSIKQPKAADRHDDHVRAQAADLVNYFHERFHGTKNNNPHPNALDQATRLIANHGLDQARHIVEFSYQAAHETNYKPQTIGGILQYIPRALAAFEETKRKHLEQTVIKEEQRRAHEEERLTRQYEDYRRDRLSALRATAPPDTLTAIEQAAGTQFDQDNTSRFGRDLLRRIAIDNAIAAHFELPSLEEWRATHGHGNVLANRSPDPSNLTNVYP